MSHCLSVATFALALLGGACGKSTQEASPAKVAEGGAPATPGDKTVARPDDKPATPPAKAIARGPERAVFSLVDNRLSAHLTRGGRAEKARPTVQRKAICSLAGTVPGGNPMSTATT